MRAAAAAGPYGFGLVRLAMAGRFGGSMRTVSAAAAFLLIAAAHSAAEGLADKCQPPPPVLWGDGEHDDYAALRDWAAGKKVLWADTGAPVPDILGDGKVYLLKEAAPFKVFPPGRQWTYFAELDGDRHVKDNLYIENYMTSGNGRALAGVRLKCSGACHETGDPPPAPEPRTPSGCLTS